MGPHAPRAEAALVSISCEIAPSLWPNYRAMAGRPFAASPQRFSISTARKSLTLVSVGPVTSRSPMPLKKVQGSLSASMALALMPGLLGAGERVGRDDGARIVLAAVDAVGVAGQSIDAGHAVKRDGERQQKLGVASAFAFALERDRGLAAGDQHARRHLGLAAHGALPRDAGVHQGHVAGLAFDRSRRG